MLQFQYSSAQIQTKFCEQEKKDTGKIHIWCTICKDWSIVNTRQNTCLRMLLLCVGVKLLINFIKSYFITLIMKSVNCYSTLYFTTVITKSVYTSGLIWLTLHNHQPFTSHFITPCTHSGDQTWKKSLSFWCLFSSCSRSQALLFNLNKLFPLYQTKDIWIENRCTPIITMTWILHCLGLLL